MSAAVDRPNELIYQCLRVRTTVKISGPSTSLSACIINPQDGADCHGR